MTTTAGQREVTLIGGTRHGQEYVINDAATPIVRNILVPFQSGDSETYTICQLKSGQWIGYIATSTPEVDE